MHHALHQLQAQIFHLNGGNCLRRLRLAALQTRSEAIQLRSQLRVPRLQRGKVETFDVNQRLRPNLVVFGQNGAVAAAVIDHFVLRVLDIQRDSVPPNPGVTSWKRGNTVEGAKKEEERIRERGLAGAKKGEPGKEIGLKRGNEDHGFDGIRWGGRRVGFDGIRWGDHVIDVDGAKNLADLRSGEIE